MKLRRAILIALLGLMAGWALWMVSAPRIRIDLAASQHDPTSMSLTPIDLSNKAFTRLENGIETGLIRLDEGGPIRYWYIGRHVQPGSGLTRFDFPDGESVYMKGAYFAEVYVDDEGAKSEAALRDFIEEMDGARWY